MTPKLFASICLVAASAACTTAGNADWYALGARDGRLGAWPQDDYLESRFSSSRDRELYMRGWDAGFAQRPGPAS